jgi:hypothetical protein
MNANKGKIDQNVSLCSVRSNQNSNSALWNAMVHPLLRSSATGAIWYQGNSNYIDKSFKKANLLRFNVGAVVDFCG